MLHCWASLHGFVTLEVNGNLNWHGAEVRESMFLGLVRLLVAPARPARARRRLAGGHPRALGARPTPGRRGS